MVEAYAKDSVDAARTNYRIELDYSPESVKTVEELLGKICPQVRRGWFRKLHSSTARTRSFRHQRSSRTRAARVASGAAAEFATMIVLISERVLNDLPHSQVRYSFAAVGAGERQTVWRTVAEIYAAASSPVVKRFARRWDLDALNLHQPNRREHREGRSQLHFRMTLRCILGKLQQIEVWRWAMAVVRTSQSLS